MALVLLCFYTDIRSRLAIRPTRRGVRVVEGARLESVYTSKAYRGFESRSLRTAVFFETAFFIPKKEKLRRSISRVLYQQNVGGRHLSGHILTNMLYRSTLPVLLWSDPSRAIHRIYLIFQHPGFSAMLHCYSTLHKGFSHSFSREFILCCTFRHPIIADKAPTR